MKKVIIVSIAVALLGTGLYWYTRPVPEAKPPTTFEVKADPFTTKITELGELRALDSVTISSQIGNTVITELIPEGVHAKKGEVLVRLDPGSLAIDLEQSKAGVQIARASLRVAEKELEVQRQQMLAEITRLGSEVRLARLELDELKRKPLPEEIDKASMQLEKAKAAFSNADKKRELLPGLVKKGFITEETLDKARLDYLEAKANLQMARFNFSDVSAGATPDELARATIRFTQAEAALEAARQGMLPKLRSLEAAVERAQAQVVQAKNLVNKHKAELEQTVLRAPRDGLVVYARIRKGASTKIHPGMVVWRGQALIHLPDLSTMVVDTELNEIDIGQVKVGDPAEVRLEAYPGGLFAGRVQEIATLAHAKQRPSGADSGIKVFNVTVKIKDKDPRLRPGLTAVVDLIVDHQEDTISVPLTAVSSRQGKHVVFVADGGEPEERRVILGPSNDHRVIVKAGLRPGEQVLLDHPTHGIR